MHTGHFPDLKRGPLMMGTGLCALLLEEDLGSPVLSLPALFSEERGRGREILKKTGK